MSEQSRRTAIARAIHAVANRWIAPNFPKDHKLPTFEQLSEKEQRLHFEYADAVLALQEPQAALERLIKIACGDTGQSKRVANFLLAWWNAERDGGFDLTDLWNVDRVIADDMITIFTFVASAQWYPDHYGYRADMEALVEKWRAPRAKRVKS